MNSLHEFNYNEAFFLGILTNGKKRILEKKFIHIYAFSCPQYSLESNEVNECMDKERKDVNMKQCRSNNICHRISYCSYLQKKQYTKNVAAVLALTYDKVIFCNNEPNHYNRNRYCTQFISVSVSLQHVHSLI